MIIFSQYKHGNELLDTLYKSETAISIENLMDRLQLSRRSIMYILKNINMELSRKQILPVENIKGIGYVISPKAKCKLKAYDTVVQNKIVLFIPNDWRLDIKKMTQEQSLIIFEYIIITNETTSINELMQIFQASRNTILSRLRALDVYNKGNSFEVQVTSKGRIIIGTESAQRKWILEKFEIILLLLKNNYKIDYDQEIVQYLHEFEQQSGNYFTDDARYILKYFLTWYFNRLSRKKTLNTGDTERGNAVKYDIDWEIKFLQGKGVYQQNEYEYLAEILRAYALAKINNKTQLYNKMHKVAEAMTDKFFLISGMTPGINHQMMIDSLAVHLISLYHRVTAGLKYNNPLLEQIKTSYHNLFIITRTAAQVLTNYLGEQPSDDEIALLATYFGSDIRSEQMNECAKQILVVCSSGIGTSQFLLMQLREKYPNIQFTGPFSVAEYLQLSFKNIGLILTTTLLEQSPNEMVPIVQISALPTKYEWDFLDKKLLLSGFAVAEYQQENIQQLMDLISNYAKIEDINGLNRSLTEYFKEKRKEQGGALISQQNNNDSLLKYITFIPDQIADWKNAIRSAFQPLLQHHFVKKEYIERIITLTENNGDYMLLGRGFLLAHAKPDDGVLNLSAAVSLCKKPIQLNSGKHIKCIICLAPVDQTSHLNFLSALLQNINDDVWCNKLYETKTKNELEYFLLESF